MDQRSQLTGTNPFVLTINFLSEETELTPSSG